MNPRAARVRIHLDALGHNLGVVRRHAPDSRVLAMVKADAYGHGAVDCAHALLMAGADALGVCCLQEALQLRDAGVLAPITVTQGPHAAEQLAAFAQHGIRAVVHHRWQIEALFGWCGESIEVWLKIDSGMGRFGVAPASVAQCVSELQAMPAVHLTGLMTHMACADEPGNEHTSAQIACFDAAVSGYDLPQSMANSASLVAWPQTRRDWVRPGIMLYGASPFKVGHPLQAELCPAMSLEAPLVAINHHRAGESVGYGAHWCCPEDMPVGLVAVGYADGYPRHAPSGTPVLVDGAPAAVIGRVSMDSVAIDLRGLAVAPGATVRLWGEGVPVNVVAERAGTIGYELLTRACPASRELAGAD